MFAKRLISSLILWAILLAVLFFLPPLASALLCCLVCMIALWEFYDMIERGGLKCTKMLGLLAGIILCAGTWWFSATQPEFTSQFEVLYLVCLMLGLFFHALVDRRNPDPLQTIGNTLMGIIYVPWLFGFLPKIKYFYQDDGGAGPGWLLVLYLVVVTKCCDSGAYLTGRAFGRHKMTPRISPNKSWEGLIGGLVAALAASITCYEYIKPSIRAAGFGYDDSLFLGLLLGVLGTLGDLSESLLKREAHVKDSGEVLPGIGGALDLIDSLLFTAPVLYVYLVLFLHA